ncbi:hypothetical protein ACOSP7_009870 [Xanthoceras sorbifolium]|uniref:CST complex subunit CTC1 n=1 Tax=Xanthoceras sorbifolium TaxID=99658 RepID=A0ABQ8HU48_9ROSI|nr:hypothetical protein JRO89_XS07G0178100 [Xanthoceras sorbifolium]
MTSAIGWYGPLIDLSRAASHVGDLVQLIVFVHRSTPFQYKLSKGGEAVRTDIHVGDDTRPFFCVSLWQKQMGLTAIAGDVILLQNVKLIKFGDVVEAKTVQYSSLQCLIHPYESLMSKGIDELLVGCQVGKTTKEKLSKVIEWVQRSKSAFRIELPSSQKRQLSRNWNVPEERKSRDCFSLSEVTRLTNSCKATFNASVGEIFLPITWRQLGEFENEKMFISRRLFKLVDKDLVEDLVCTGCQLCGSPLDLGCGSTLERNSVPLHCDRSSNRLHVVNFIYRPFMLYVWDELEYMPLLVRNNGAELLFGNIKAERVYQCYKERKHDQYPDTKDVKRENHYNNARATKLHKVATEAVLHSCSLDAEKQQCDKNINSYLIWLILLRMLLKQGKNSPLKFEVVVNGGLDKENGRYEMVGVSVPCFITKYPAH